MARKKLPKNRPTESRIFVDPSTGWNITVIRGRGAEAGRYHIPHWMDGVGMRKTIKNLKEEIDLWCNFEDAETLEKELAAKEVAVESAETKTGGVPSNFSRKH